MDCSSLSLEVNCSCDRGSVCQGHAPWATTMEYKRGKKGLKATYNGGG